MSCWGVFFEFFNDVFFEFFGLFELLLDLFFVQIWPIRLAFFDPFFLLFLRHFLFTLKLVFLRTFKQNTVRPVLQNTQIASWLLQRMVLIQIRCMMMVCQRLDTLLPPEVIGQVPATCIAAMSGPRCAAGSPPA